MPDRHFDIFCPHCIILISAKEIASGSSESRSMTSNPMDQEDAPYKAEHYTVALCPRCNSPFLLKESLYGIPGEFESVSDFEILYPSASRMPLGDLPASVDRAFDQATKSYGASLFEPSALMCRRCLEAVCTSFSIPGRRLADRLDALAKVGHIDDRLREWAQSIRVLGNEAAHDTDTDTTKEDAKAALDFTEALLLYVFTLKRKHEAFLSRRTAKVAQAKIEGGDV